VRSASPKLGVTPTPGWPGEVDSGSAGIAASCTDRLFRRFVPRLWRSSLRPGAFASIPKIEIVGPQQSSELRGATAESERSRHEIIREARWIREPIQPLR
jgi:hypothetical protein